MKYYLKVLKNYVKFSGRASRHEYWLFFLFNLLFAFVAVFLDHVIGIYDKDKGFGLIFLFYMLVLYIPSLALTMRRLHDIGKSGWFILIVSIPLVGSIWLLVLMCTKGDVGENAYGTDPIEIESEHTNIDNSIIDSIILYVLCFIFIEGLYWTSIKTTLFLSFFIRLLWFFVPFILTFLLKNKILRIVLLIISCIYLGFMLYLDIPRFYRLLSIPKY